MRLARLFRSTLLVTTSLALVACTTLRVVPTGPAATAHGPAGQPLAPGDVVQVTLRDGSTLELSLTQVSDSGLQGLKAAAAATQTLAFAAIATVERKQLDVLKTSLLVTALVVGIYFVAQALLISKLAAAS
jgi:hypothetical protein